MTLKFTKAPKRKGTNRIAINVDYMDVPVGQIWTYRDTTTETHPFQAKHLNGDHGVFGTLDEAKNFFRGA